MSDKHASAVVSIERVEPTQGLSPVVSAGMDILRKNPSPETLRELLAVQREWEANEARRDYAAAIVNLKRDLPTVIGRDKTVDFGTTHYTHASLGNVMEVITGPVTMHGFSLTWHPSTEGGNVSVTCRLTHSSGHFEEVKISAPADNKGSKSPAQGVASTITLLQRYTALSLLGIATADMKEPEGEAEPQPDVEKIDSGLNMKAVAWVIKQGRTKQQAEEHLKRDMSEWTQADRQELKTWAKEPPTGVDE